MSALPKKKYITEEEYLDLEELSETRNEYFNGEIFAMSGASYNHVICTGNINASLNNQLKKRDCRVLNSNMRVLIKKTGLYTYPDTTVVCGKSELKKHKGLETLTNPVLIVEVLSPSTADYDKGAKFEHYRTIDSLQEYVLVWQDKKRVARYTKQSDNSWNLQDFIGDDADIELKSIECLLTMDDIYDKVVFTEVNDRNHP
jgi:Uma2 family endonuclease